MKKAVVDEETAWLVFKLLRHIEDKMHYSTCAYLIRGSFCGPLIFSLASFMSKMERSVVDIHRLSSTFRGLWKEFKASNRVKHDVCALESPLQ